MDSRLQTRDASRRLIVGSAIIGSIGTFSLHVLLPALPAIASAMQVGPHAAQLLISLSILAIALGNLMVAPLSDRYGRRAIVLLALALFVLGSAAGIVADSLGMLVAARVVQAFGGGAAMSVMRATILDHFGPAHSRGRARGDRDRDTGRAHAGADDRRLRDRMLDWRAVFALSGLLGFAVFLFASRNLRDARRADRVGGPVAALLVEFPAPARLARVPRLPGFRLVHGQHDLHVRDRRTLRRDRRVRRVALAIRPAALLPGARFVRGFLLAARVTGRLGGQRMMRAGAMIAFAGTLSMAALALAARLASARDLRCRAW